MNPAPRSGGLAAALVERRRRRAEIVRRLVRPSPETIMSTLSALTPEPEKPAGPVTPDFAGAVRNVDQPIDLGDVTIYPDYPVCPASRPENEVIPGPEGAAGIVDKKALDPKDIIFNIFGVTTQKLFERTDRERTSQPAPFGRATSLSSRIVADVRDALFEGRLKPGDFLGGEKDIAAQSGVSRMAARDALRTLEALGIVEIKMGKGGGVRVTQGNPRLLAEALAVQLELAGVEPREIVDAQRAVECVAAELAAENATPEDIRRLRELVADAASKTHDIVAFTDSTREFHLAVAEASHNRVLVVQLISLQHVTWPQRNLTQTLSVANKILRAHRELVDLIEARDAAGARQSMDDHVKMIRTRRSSPPGTSGSAQQSCC